jgi:hypothetical protein
MHYSLESITHWCVKNLCTALPALQSVTLNRMSLTLADLGCLKTQPGETPELLGLVRALAPLVSKEVKLSIHMLEAVAGAAEVQQLGDALGSSLKQLALEACELPDGFWPAVWENLPGLQQLTVGDRVWGATDAHELAVFCSRATRPLQLRLGWNVFKRVGAEGKLERQCQVRGMHQVTVTQAVGT